MNLTNENNQQYKEHKIYQVLNSINDKVYVGSTCQLLRKRLDVHRQYSVNRVGLIYEEMRRIGQEHFYIELIENYPCNPKEAFVSKLNYYINERGTLNNRTTARLIKKVDVEPVILELKTMMQEIHKQLNNIEDKINTLLNISYPAGLSTPSQYDEQETETNSQSESLEIINISTSTPEVFKIFDDYDIEETSPPKITPYDLTEKHFSIFQNKIPDGLYKRIEKQAHILCNAEKQQEMHPNDKDRSLFIEVASQKLADDLTQAKRFYLENDAENLDMLKNKIPEKQLEELKIISANLYNTSVALYEESKTEAIELTELYISTFEKKKQNAIEEAFTYYILYKNENPNDKSNIECDKHFNLWLKGDITVRTKNNKKKHRRR